MVCLPEGLVQKVHQSFHGAHFFSFTEKVKIFNRSLQGFGMEQKIKYSGNALLWSIFHYERFGGDPQKRGLQNRLVSELVLSALLGKSSNVNSTLQLDFKNVLICSKAYSCRDKLFPRLLCLPRARNVE